MRRHGGQYDVTVMSILVLDEGQISHIREGVSHYLYIGSRQPGNLGQSSRLHRKCAWYRVLIYVTDVGIIMDMGSANEMRR